MNTPTKKLALAAAVILIVLGGITFWPGGDAESGKWWLGPPAAWGRYITPSLDKVNALVYREGYVFVGGYGSTHVSGNWSRWYKSADRRRRDMYYGEQLVSTMWEVPNGAGSVLRYDVSFEHQCYTVQAYESGESGLDPVEMLHFYVGLLAKADRVLGTETFEGKTCTGFEISASQYGDNPDTRVDRIWFDTDTKLPVRIEKHGLPVTNHPEQTATFVQDEFEYYVDVPADKFEPEIPEGFVNRHPDEIRAARERNEKGPMVVAEIPAGVKDDLIAALNQVDTVAYRQWGSVRTYLSRDAWREDHFGGETLRITEWFVIQKDDPAPTSLDINDKDFRLVHTVVDYDAGTYRQVTHDGDTRPSHPMDYIRFRVGHIDRADEILDNQVIDDHQCFGFKLSAKKYGSNPDHMIHYLWFDVTTNLPVRMELERLPDGATEKVKTVEDQFDWNPQLPDDFFVPRIPPGFTQVND